MTYSDEIKQGSIVRLAGPKSYDPVRHMTWTVVRLDQAEEGLTYATVRSGGSGQTRVYPVHKLTLHRIQEDS